MRVTADLAKFKPSELSRLLWGFAAAHHEDGALAKLLSKALVDKAGELSGREAIQVRADLNNLTPFNFKAQVAASALNRTRFVHHS